MPSWVGGGGSAGGSRHRPGTGAASTHPGSDLKHCRMSRQAGWIFPENSQVTRACRRDKGVQGMSVCSTGVQLRAGGGAGSRRRRRRATQNPIACGTEAHASRRLPAQSPRPVRCSGAVWASWLGPLAPGRRCCWAPTCAGRCLLTLDQREWGRRAPWRARPAATFLNHWAPKAFVMWAPAPSRLVACHCHCFHTLWDPIPLPSCSQAPLVEPAPRSAILVCCPLSLHPRPAGSPD